MMECTYVYVMSNMMNTSVGQKMHLFMTVISNLCINRNIVGLAFIIDMMHLFFFEDKNRETKKKSVYALIEFFGGLFHV